MKYRSDFVTNSSSSSYTCNICGRTESGWDISLSEAGMVECVNGHTICEDEMLPIPRSELIKFILERAADDEEPLTEEELNQINDDGLLCKFMDLDDVRYEIPEAFCPICQFIEYSEYDLAHYLEKQYGISRDEVFAEVKKVNKRRKKLYENEYITYVCQRFNLNPSEVVAGWKKKFDTYANFKQYLNGGTT